MGHQPMYCSNADQDDCTNYDSRPRSGFTLYSYVRIRKDVSTIMELI